MHNFILLAQTNNIARATGKTHMMASPFGKNIVALEEQVDYMLFTRKDNNISLNKAGQELYQKLFSVYQRLSAIDNGIHNSGHRSWGTVTGIDNTCPTIIFGQLVSLGDKYEGVTAQSVEFSESDVIDNLFDRQLDLIISPQHVSARVQELEDLTISELSPLRLSFLVSRRCEECQKQGLLQESPWLQTCPQNRVNFGAITDANMRPCGVNPTIIYRPCSFMTKISAVEHGHFLTIIPHFTWRLVNPTILEYLDTSHRPMYMQEYLYSIRSHRYTATILQHITKDRDGANHQPSIEPVAIKLRCKPKTWLRLW